jgi:hypothetical protein
MDCAIDLIKNSTRSDFTLSPDSLSITNNTDVQWQDFVGEDGGMVTPTIDKGMFVLSMGANHITVLISGAHYRYRKSHTVYMNVQQNFSFQVGTNAKNEPVFVVDETETGFGNASVDAMIVADKGINITTTLFEVIAMVAGLLVGVASTAEKCAAEAEGTAAIDTGLNSASAVFLTPESSVAYAANASTAFVKKTFANLANGFKDACPTLYNSSIISTRTLKWLAGGSLITFGGESLAEAVIEGRFDGDIPSFERIADTIAASIVFPAQPGRTLKTCSINDCFIVGVKLVEV